MRNLIILIGFIITALLLYGIWGSLNSKLIAIESKTGSYLPTPLTATEFDDTALLKKLALMESRQAENERAIAAILEKLDQMSEQDCQPGACANRVVSREVIYFSHNQSELESTEMAKIDSLLQNLEDDSIISLRGHADTSGDNRYNHLLSLRRAVSVKSHIDKNLVEDGLPSNRMITLSGSGEELTFNSTKDGVEDPSNRVVEILILQ